MKIEEYESPATSPIADTYAPRTKASQVVAAAHRAGDTEPSTPIATVRNPKIPEHAPLAILAVGLVLAMVAMITWQLSHPVRPLAVQAAPTSVPTSAPTSTPALTSAPTSTPVPTSADTSIAPQTGQGLTLHNLSVEPAIWPTPTEQAAAWNGTTGRSNLSYEQYQASQAAAEVADLKNALMDATTKREDSILSQEQYDASQASSEAQDLKNAMAAP